MIEFFILLILSLMLYTRFSAELLFCLQPSMSVMVCKRSRFIHFIEFLMYYYSDGAVHFR